MNMPLLTFVIDIDDTLCKTETINGKRDYSTSIPFPDMIWRVNSFHEQGHKIILFTARQVNTYKGDIDLIHKHTKPVLEKWLKDHKVKYDELIFGKPWGENVVYVDDKALTTTQFLRLPITDETSKTKDVYLRSNNRSLNLTNGIKGI
jgi:capsule biosynthesis phosphatase